MSAPRLVANLGAEEAEGGASGPAAPGAAALAEAWRGLFELPAAFAWLEGCEAAAWWNTPAAAREVAPAPLLGAAPEVVRRVHDKAFALEVAREEGWEPPVLRGLATPFDADVLTAPDAAERVEAALRAWPAWARNAFTLKPRIGTSGRGRVAGRDGRLDDAARRALPRLAARGGAVLEPWLERLQDASVQLFVDGAGTVILLGVLEALVSPAGVPRGHRGLVDRRRRVRSGLPEEEALREAGAALAGAAARAGYRGPCGVDAFAFRHPEDGRRVLRPAVELNARFTAGTVAIGHLRRAFPSAQPALELHSGQLVPFAFLLEPPAAGWPPSEPGRRFLWPAAGRADGPALVLDRDAAALAALAPGAAGLGGAPLC